MADHHYYDLMAAFKSVDLNEIMDPNASAFF